MIYALMRPVSEVQFFDDEEGRATVIRFTYSDGEAVSVCLLAEGLDTFTRLARQSAGTLLANRLRLATSNEDHT